MGYLGKLILATHRLWKVAQSPINLITLLSTFNSRFMFVSCHRQIVQLFINGPTPASIKFIFCSFQATFDRTNQLTSDGFKLGWLQWKTNLLTTRPPQPSPTKIQNLFFTPFFAKNGPFPASFFFFLFSSFQYTVDSKQMFHLNKTCRWLDSNCGPLVSVAAALPTEPHNHCPFFTPF